MIITIFNPEFILTKYIVPKLIDLGFYVNIIANDLSECRELKIYGLAGKITITKAKNKDYNFITNILHLSDLIIHFPAVKSYKKSDLFLEEILDEYSMKNNNKLIKVEHRERQENSINRGKIKVFIGDIIAKDSQMILSSMVLKNMPLILNNARNKQSKISLTCPENAALFFELLIKDLSGIKIKSFKLVNQEINYQDFILKILKTLNFKGKVLNIPFVISGYIYKIASLIPSKMIASFTAFLEPISGSSVDINAENGYSVFKIKEKNMDEIIGQAINFKDNHYLKNMR
jgi:hypothetical protein